MYEQEQADEWAEPTRARRIRDRARVQERSKRTQTYKSKRVLAIKPARVNIKWWDKEAYDA